MPLVSKTFDQLLDFTRTSAATFVGSNGLVQTTPASVNLLTQTQQFDNAAWIKFNSSATANTTVAPDGTSTADTFTENTATGQHGVYQGAAVVSGSTYTWSGYVKNNGRSIVQFQLQATANVYFVEFDLTAVTTTNRSGTGTATITDAGNGWYRITATATATGSGTGYWQLNLCSAANTASYTGNGTSGIFIWGAQLEAASAATTYTRNNGGVFPPRFDYDPVTLAAKGLLIEEQRTNLALNSAFFPSTVWAKINASLTTGIDDPAGGSLATTLTATAADGTIQQAAVSTAGTYSTSIWIRRRTGTGQVSLRCGDLTAIPITVTSSWVRYTATAVATSTTIRLAVILNVSGDEVDIWGGQIEAGAFATSYIPTAGASTVTRTTDQCAIVAPNFAPWYNQSEGSFVFEGSALAPSTLAFGYNALTASDGTLNNCNRIGLYSNFWFTDTRTGNVTQANVSPPSSYTQNATAKVAYAYKTNDFAASVNGGTALTDTSGTVPTVVNRLLIGGPTLELNGHIRSIRYFPVRLSNAQLQALTA